MPSKANAGTKHSPKSEPHTGRAGGTGNAATASSVDLRPAVAKFGLPVRSQGGRGTCSVFTIVGAIEYAQAARDGRGRRLSVEFVNWASNQATRNSADGGFFSDLWAGFAAYGACPEADMPYRAKYDPAVRPTPTALEHARQALEAGLCLHWIKPWNVKTGLSDAQFSQIKKTLRAGTPVCAGLRWPKQERWTDGVLEMAPPKAVFDGHSVLVVGYRDDPRYGGGGILLIRNSGKASDDGAMTYEYARAYTNDAAWVGLKAAASAPGPAGARASRPARAAAAAPGGAKEMTNSLGMRLVRIEPGAFVMGSDRGDHDERPAHKVRITRPFHLAATEVTNAQYERFDPAHKALRGKLGFSKADDEAVVFVSWHEAAAFCRWLSRKEHKPYRLPTEAEWEYACRAGTTTPYHTGEALPKAFHKNARLSWYPGRPGPRDVVPLHVGKTPPNPWGLHDMHGNVEEWCRDWYGPYSRKAGEDPVGHADGDFKVTRGGSHSSPLAYLRSANRAGTLPEDKSWLIGFRVACGQMPKTASLPPPKPPRHARNVRQKAPQLPAKGPDPNQPFFRGPRQYVKIPPGSDGPLFSRHNHCPAIVNCPNGDLLAIWYTCRTEPGRELDIAASRLRRGAEEWEPASWFWGAPDRNDHASALWVDEKGTLYHFNGLSAAGTWGSLATILRTSTDSGRTWSKARLIMPEHGPHHMPIESVFRLADGTILVPCDAAPGGSGGSAVLLSKDDGRTWTDPAEGKPVPSFRKGTRGPTIAGIHAGVVQRKDGTLMAFGRRNNIDGRMPMSLSEDGGKSWTYRASPWPGLGGGQRLVILRLREGPILFCSFARRMMIKDAAGKERPVSGLFAALSYDEGKTWPVRKLISDYGPPRRVDGGGNTHWFTMGEHSGEPRGYLSVCQTPDGVIQLISSKQHYQFNLAWAEAPMPAAKTPPPSGKPSRRPGRPAPGRAP